MPELPEVETIARGLARRVTGDVMESVWLGSKPEPLKSPAREIVATLESKRIADVRRVGKHIVFDLEPTGQTGERPAKPLKSRGSKSRLSQSRKPTSSKARGAKAASIGSKTTSEHSQWIVHLGMTGSVVVSTPDAEVEKHTHAIVKLASGKELRFVDPRRFGRLSVAHQFQAAGSEPLEVELDRFVELFKGRKTPIKSALLNQGLLSGVGNIYADESLHIARIHPLRTANTLSDDEIAKLYAGIRQALSDGIRYEGASINWYRKPDGTRGESQDHLRVYRERGNLDKPCPVCGSPITKIWVGQRGTHFCPSCQTR